MNTRIPKALHAGAVASLLGLIILCTLWELQLAPLRPGGSWLVLKVLPLLLPLRGLLRRDLYTMQWASMMILLYFIEGVVRAASITGLDHPLTATMAWIEIILVSIFFFCTVFYLRPYKQEAKRLARQAIERASHSEVHK
jgi:uncharacterized membrane protein